MYKLINTNYLHTKDKLPYGSTYLHILQLHSSPIQAFMPFLNLNTFSALFIVSGMAFQRILPRNAREFIPKDIVHTSIPSARKVLSFHSPNKIE